MSARDWRRARLMALRQIEDAEEIRAIGNPEFDAESSPRESVDTDPSSCLPDEQTASQPHSNHCCGFLARFLQTG